MDSTTSPVKAGPTSLRAVWPAMVGLSAVFLFEMLDNSILNVALPTIGRSLHASTTELQWVTGSYAVMFGGLMLAFGAIADRFGRRRVMLIGLALLAAASLATAFVTTPAELIAVRAATGVAAAMTAPGSMALSFRLFTDDALRVRASALVSTIGLVGVAIGPTLGGLALAVAPWQALLLINVPVALLAMIGIRIGIPSDRSDELHRDPVDILGAVLGTVMIVLALVSPTLFIEQGIAAALPWVATVGAVLTGAAFVLRERLARHPILELRLILRPLVMKGLAYQAALGLALAGFGFTVTLQLQLAWGWPPALAALGTLPQIITMIAVAPLVERLVKRVGMDRAALLGAAAVLSGLLLYALLGRFTYAWIAVALVVTAAGMRIVMITSTINVMRGLPHDRTSMGAALNDTSQELASSFGFAITGTAIATLFSGSITAPGWTTEQTDQFQNAVTAAALILTILAATITAWATLRARPSRTNGPSVKSSDHRSPQSAR